VPADPTHLECREPDGRKLKYRTATVLASAELQARCTQKRALKRLLAGTNTQVGKTNEHGASPAVTSFGVISKIGLFFLPSLAVFGVRAMIRDRKSNRE
jgi:hypothetical protein